MVLGERQILRDIVTASLTLSVLQILPVMVAIDRVLTNHGMTGALAGDLLPVDPQARTTSAGVPLLNTKPAGAPSPIV